MRNPVVKELPLDEHAIAWALDNDKDTGSSKITLFCDFIRALNSLEDGLILSQILYWSLPTIKEDKDGLRVIKKATRLQVNHDGYYWWAMPLDDWQDLAGITRSTAQRAIKRLVDLGVVIRSTYKFAGKPVLHLRIDPSGFQAFCAKYIPGIAAHSIDGYDWTVYKKALNHGEIWENPEEEKPVENVQLGQNDLHGNINQVNQGNLEESCRSNCPTPLTETCNSNLSIVTDSLIKQDIFESESETNLKINLINSQIENLEKVSKDFLDGWMEFTDKNIPVKDRVNNVRDFIALRCKGFFVFDDLTCAEDLTWQNREYSHLWFDYVKSDFDYLVKKHLKKLKDELQKLEKDLIAKTTVRFSLEEMLLRQSTIKKSDDIPQPIESFQSKNLTIRKDLGDQEKPEPQKLPYPPGCDESGKLIIKPPENQNPADSYRERAKQALARGLQNHQNDKTLGSFPEHLRPLAKEFIQSSGLHPLGKQVKTWLTGFIQLYEQGLQPEHVRDAIYHMRREGLMISSPYSVFTAANEVRMGTNKKFRPRRFDPDTGTEVPWGVRLVTLEEAQNGR